MPLKKIDKKIKNNKTILVLLFMFIIVLCSPTISFRNPISNAIFDDQQNLIGAHVASDGQWRFMPTDTIPYKFAKCITLFEDEQFDSHFGISIKAIGRAIYWNCKQHKIVSGGSTITMQVARLHRSGKPRTYWEKCVEIMMAIKLEISNRKKTILALYANNAPFGNNVVGLSSASWRYFNKKPNQLTWAENATLAVLPNAPSLIYPGKNEAKLLKKRNRLLLKLLAKKVIDTNIYLLSISEPLPTKPLPLPQIAAHFLAYYCKQNNSALQYNINKNLQLSTQQIIETQLLNLGSTNIKNASVLVTENNSGKILVYIGNALQSKNTPTEFVDCAQAPRSTGSILKPFLYACALQDGLITPTTLLPDVPMAFGSFNPKNYAKTYDGLVPAKKALARSLNIPFVYLLQQYATQKFKLKLNQLGLPYINKNSTHYGLSLILGGAEESLFHLHNTYSSLAKQLNNNAESENQILNNAVIYETFNAMREVNRPDEQGSWKLFENSQHIAWKTGTSFGNRDAWAIGVTPKYTVSVWVGNAQGEGDNALTGFKASAPILFSVFNILPLQSKWFMPPNANVASIKICHQSGMRTGPHCTTVDIAVLPNPCLQSDVCAYHKCVSNTDTLFSSKIIFDLPPLMAYYYYQHKINTPENAATKSIAKQKLIITYPAKYKKIIITKNETCAINPIILECIYTNKTAKLFWHVNDVFIGTTQDVHQIKYTPQIGNYKLKVTTENGEEQSVDFVVKDK